MSHVNRREVILFFFFWTFLNFVREYVRHFNPSSHSLSREYRIKFSVSSPPARVPVSQTLFLKWKKKTWKYNEKYTGPFSVDDFSLLPRDDSGGGVFIILFCNITYFLHINSEPLTRFIVCMRNRIVVVVVVVFGIVLCFYCIFFPASVSTRITRGVRTTAMNTAVVQMRRTAYQQVPRSYVNNFRYHSKNWDLILLIDF